MKNMVKKTTLGFSGKKLTNHSARRTVIKKLKKARVQNSDIIGITGHSTEAGLDPYDSGDEVQQKEYSHVIDNVSSSSSCVIKPQPPASRVFPQESLPSSKFTSNIPSSSNCNSYSSCTIKRTPPTADVFQQESIPPSDFITNNPSSCNPYSSYTIKPQNTAVRTFQKESLPPKRFNFFSDETYEKMAGYNTVPLPPTTMNFHNCSVYIGSDFGKPAEMRCEKQRRKRVRFISSSDESSQELL